MDKQIIKNNILNNLDKLIYIKKNQYIYQKKYSQKEFDILLNQSIQFLFILYEQAKLQKNILINKIKKIKNKFPSIEQLNSIYKQYGGKKYSINEVNNMINISIQQIFILYIQIINEIKNLKQIYDKALNSVQLDQDLIVLSNRLHTNNRLHIKSTLPISSITINFYKSKYHPLLDITSIPDDEFYSSGILLNKYLNIYLEAKINLNFTIWNRSNFSISLPKDKLTILEINMYQNFFMYKENIIWLGKQYFLFIGNLLLNTTNFAYDDLTSFFNWLTHSNWDDKNIFPLVNDIGVPILAPLIKSFNIDNSLLIDIEFKDFIKLVPKTELHIHLEGCITKQLYIDMGGTHPNIDTLSGFDLFREYFNTFITDFEINMERLLKHIFNTRVQENIFYTQFQYTALKIKDKTGNYIPIKTQFDTIITIINNIQKDPIYDNIYIDFILDIPRGNAKSLPLYTQYFTDIISLLTSSNSSDNKYKQYIRGIGIGGTNESNTMGTTYKTDYDKINNDHHILIVPHAGELGSTNIACSSLKDCLDSYNVKRVGHGVRILECESLTNSEQIVRPINQFYLDICITSNLIFIPSPKYTINTHPIKELINKNYNITLSTDDPGLLKQQNAIYLDQTKYITLNSEYILLYYTILNDKIQLDRINYIKKIIFDGIECIPEYYINDNTNITNKIIYDTRYLSDIKHNFKNTVINLFNRYNIID